MRRFALAVLALLLAAASPFDAPAAPAWSERAVPERLDQATAAALPLADLLRHGRELFTAKFTTLDGAGRPTATQAIIPTRRRHPTAQAFQRLAGPDASACASCHLDPVVGAAGDFVTNAFVAEGFTSADFDSLDPQFSNERGTTHLMGAGLIELLAREMTRELQAQRRTALREARAAGADRRVDLATKGVIFGTLVAHADGTVDVTGIDGVDVDLVVRPLSQKGVIPSLRQFTVNALNAHHGMQAVERFGARWTGTADFDRDDVGDELRAGDVTALTLFQAALPPPVRAVPEDPSWRAAAAEGEALFDALGCAACHRPHLPLDSLVFAEPAGFHGAGSLRPGEVARGVTLDLADLAWAAELPRDDAGRVLVPLFGDLKRHAISDARVDTLGNELLAQRFVARDRFLTAELWGVGSTGPYGHRGDLTTLDAVIRAHGGAARGAGAAYATATDDERSALVAFLRTLVIPCPHCDAAPAPLVADD